MSTNGLESEQFPEGIVLCLVSGMEHTNKEFINLILLVRNAPDQLRRQKRCVGEGKLRGADQRPHFYDHLINPGDRTADRSEMRK